nr:EscU/YscU/HrcU family type III secretion system export apparatus switch protein [Microbacterium barkeri]
MSGTDSGERSEKATDKHLREARQKGRIARSQDLTAWLGIGAAAITTPAAIALGASAGTEQLLTLTSLTLAPTSATRSAPFVTTTNMSIGAVIQGGVHLRKLSGRFEQFNIVTGLRRVFGMQALWEGAKALLKTAAIGIALWLVIAGLMPVLTASGAHSITRLLGTATEGTTALLQTAIAVGLGLAAIDMFVVMRRNRKHTRMTKREIRDENKNSEGDPLIRQQRRSRQLAVSRNRMIAAVAGSDVVLVNPTHVAVALRYEAGRSAPKVVAKGSGVIAERIRDEAARAGVPMVREITLARALHAACELGQEIPEDLYNAVARVLVFVDALRRRGAARGIHSLPYRRTA